jgi:Fur family iron response transcriptional regulator
MLGHEERLLQNRPMYERKAGMDGMVRGNTSRIRHSPTDALQSAEMPQRPSSYTRDNLAEVLRARDINPTHQRIEIAHALFSRGEHLSADRILAIVNGRHSETSKATVYNTLNLFLAKNLIREVIVDPNKVFYDPNIEPHHHFYNLDTGELTDIEAAGVEVHGLPGLPEGMITDGVDIIVRVRQSASFTIARVAGKASRVADGRVHAMRTKINK